MTMNPVTEHTEIAALTPMESPPLDVVVPLPTPNDPATVGRAGAVDSHDGSVMRVTSSVVVGGAVDVDEGKVSVAPESVAMFESVVLPEIDGVDIGRITGGSGVDAGLILRPVGEQAPAPPSLVWQTKSFGGGPGSRTE